MRLSIVICLYNTDKKYLTECLDSIYGSTLKKDFETVVIDDGSTLDYSDIREKYPIKYKKIENRGHLGARLEGICCAEGDYIAFVDSDDTVSKNFHRPMLERAIAEDADIVINGWAFHTERTKRVCINDSTMSRRIYAEGDDALLLFASQEGREHSYFVNWNKIFKRELLLSTKAKLDGLGISDMRLTYSEDALMNFFNFKAARRVVNINSGFYFYRIHTSQSIVITGADKIKSQIDCMSFSIGIMKENIGENKHRDSIGKSLDLWAGLMARAQYTHAKSAGAAELFPYIKEKYGLDKLSQATYRDGEVYGSSELLGKNFDEIDRVLSEIYLLGRDTAVNYERKSKCISRIIADMPHRVEYSKHGEFTVPRRLVSFKNRVIHNHTVYRLGMIFFKKGSKIRAFLKKHL